MNIDNTLSTVRTLLSQFDPKLSPSENKVSDIGKKALSQITSSLHDIEAKTRPLETSQKVKILLKDVENMSYLPIEIQDTLESVYDIAEMRFYDEEYKKIKKGDYSGIEQIENSSVKLSLLNFALRNDYTNLKDLTELAYLHLKIDPKSFLAGIGKYKTLNVADKITLLKEVVKTHSISDCLLKFEFFDPKNHPSQKDLLELLQLAKHCSFDTLAIFSDHMNHETPEAQAIIEDIAYKAICDYPILLYEVLSYVKILSDGALLKFFNKAYELEPDIKFTERYHDKGLSLYANLIISGQMAPELKIDEFYQKLKEMKGDPQSSQKYKNLLLFTYQAILKIKKANLKPELINPTLFETIAHVASPHLRMRLIDFLCQNLTPETQRKFDVLQHHFGGRQMSLPNFMLSICPELSEEERLELSQTIKGLSRSGKTAFIRDGPKLQVLIDCFLHILSSDLKTSDQKKLILDLLTESKDIDAFVRILHKTIAVIRLKEQKRLENRNDSLEEQLSAIIEASFNERVPLGKVPDLRDKLLQFLTTFRNTDAFFHYAASMKRRPEVLSQIGECITHIMKDDFLLWRYDLKRSVHLNEIFQNRPELLASWRNNLVGDVNKLDVSTEKEQQVDYQALLKASFEKKHIGKDDFAELWEFLNASSENQAVIKAKMKEKFVSAAKGDLNKLKFMNYAMLLTTEKNPKMIANYLQKMDFSYPKEDKLKQEIKEWIAQLATPKKETQEAIHAMESDNPNDLFNCGTEAKGSCQSAYDFKDNHALMAYVNDGKNKLIVIRKADNTIDARAILRILLDDKKQPVLFLEKVYPVTTSEAKNDAILQLALQKAETMGLRLFSKEVGKGKAYSGNILSLGSPAPYEYVDAVEAGQTDGSFTISDPLLISLSIGFQAMLVGKTCRKKFLRKNKR